MAMLAEPRRKARYIVNPTGKDWLSAQTDDGGGGGQFGQRMLQSMGWRAGQGLGKDGQGAAEPIKVKRKSDQRGVGCSGAYAADTMPQSVDFASLLSELNAAHGTGSGSEAVAAASLVPAVSLEAKSRASRARLHYQKFTRGKDVSAYDKQSLACIFGSRAARLSDDGAAEDGTGGVQEGGALATAAAVCMGVPRSQSEDCLLAQGAEDPSDGSAKHGLQLVQSQTSLQDYFRVKMAELQQRRLQQQEQPADSSAPAAEVDPASWTSESSCSAASTPASKAAGEDRGGDAKKRRVRFSLSPSPPLPSPAPMDSPPPSAVMAEETLEDLVVIDFTLYPGSALHRILGYPLY